MSETAVLDVTPDQVSEYEATIDHYIAEMEIIREQIASNRRETASLRAETEVMLTNTLTLLKVS